MSHVTCQIFFCWRFCFFGIKKNTKNIVQRRGASPWRVRYQRGLPRLVYLYIWWFIFLTLCCSAIHYSVLSVYINSRATQTPPLTAKSGADITAPIAFVCPPSYPTRVNRSVHSAILLGRVYCNSFQCNIMHYRTVQWNVARWSRVQCSGLMWREVQYSAVQWSDVEEVQ